MSTTKRSISVTRTHKPEADACLRALTALLKKPVRTEGSPTLATPEDMRGEFKHDSHANDTISE